MALTLGSTELDPATATQWGLFYTAINHVAHETETGGNALGQGLLAPARFGVEMNIVERGLPENSYLVYKLLEKPGNFLPLNPSSCVTGHHSPVADTDCEPPSPDEQVRLQEWFVRGDGMPKTDPGRFMPAPYPDPAHITREDLVKIVEWIRDGAECPPPP